METLWQELRYGMRALRARPGFSTIAISVFALGIGANTAIFSVVSGVLLKPLPYQDGDRLLSVGQRWGTNPDERDVISSDDYIALREGTGAAMQIAAYVPHPGGFTITDRAVPEQITGTAVTAEMFEVLGTRPLLGRTFLPGDERPDAEPVAVLSQALWQRRFGGDPGIVGRTLTIDSRSHTIVGVMPAGFRFPRDQIADLWSIFRPERSGSRPPYYLRTVARARPGVSPSEIEGALQSVTRQVKALFPDAPSDWTFDAAPLKDDLVGDVRPALFVLLGAVALVHLIATANIANLLLARATARRKEMAIRAALGAGRIRLIRQMLTESLVLAGMGGFFGVILSLWGVELLVRMGPRNLPRLNEIGIDPRVLLYTTTLSVLSGILVGLAPAFKASRPALAPMLNTGARGNTDTSGRRLRSLLVVTEFALAVMLLSGAGLLIRSFLRLQRVNPGFNSGGILTASISLPEARYSSEASRATFFRGLLERANNLPGVQAAAISMSLPPDLLNMTNPYIVEGRPIPPGSSPPAVAQLLIGGDYFRALGVPLLRGRPFNATDVAGNPEVVIINQTMAATVFRGEEPIGRRIQLGDPNPQSPWVTIVGVVGDVKYTGLDKAPEPTMYTPYEQNLWWPTMNLLIRSSVDPRGLEQVVRAQVAGLDPLLGISKVRTLDDLIWQSVAEPRFRTTLLGVFAASALLLAALGIYGVLSYTVGQRTQEFGIRMALGARRRDVLSLVLRQGMALACVGVSIGLGAALALSRVLSRLLFGVAPTDPTTFIAVPLVMTAAALLASYVPARRATRVDPAIALRAE